MRVLHWYANFLAGGAIAETVLGLANAQVALGDHVMVASSRREGAVYNPRIREELQASLHTWEPAATFTFGKLSGRVVPASSLRSLRAFRPDILHIHGGVLPEDVIIRTCLPGVRSVLTAHGSFYEQGLRPRMRAYIRMLKPVLYRRVAAVHAVSPDESEIIRDLLPSQEIYVVPNGLSPRFSGAHPDRPPGSEADGRPVRLICVGRLDVQTKGLDILLSAFAHASQRSSLPLELALVGPFWGQDRPRILNMIDDLALGPLVSLLGPMDRDGIFETLAEADIFIQMSRWEAFSMAAIEALALELPCVLSSRVGAASYPMIATLPHVRLTEPNVERASDAIQDVVRSLAVHRAAARRLAPSIRERFSWGRIAAEHELVYRRLQPGRRGG